MSDNVCENGYEDLEEDYTIGEEYQVRITELGGWAWEWGGGGG